MAAISRTALAITALILVPGGVAYGQAMGGGGGAPGTGDATKMSAGARESREEYNRVIAKTDGVPVAQRAVGRAVPATAADLTPGSEVRDSKGAFLGTIQAVEGEDVVVATAVTRIKIPAIGFGKDKKGLLLSITKAQFDAAVASVSQPAG